MKILCCLLSDQHIPNLLSIHHLKPDQLVLIESKEMNNKKRAENLLKALELGELDYKDRYDRVNLKEVSDFKEIRDCLETTYKKYSFDEWIVNLTGGNKPMSIMAYEFFKEKGAQLIYIEQSRPNEIINVLTFSHEKIEYRPNVEEFLTGYGFGIKNPEEVKEGEERARMWWDISCKIASIEEGFSTPGSNWGQARRNGSDLKAGELIVKDEELKRKFSSTFGLTETENGLEGYIDKHIAQFLKGGWLEVFFWGLLDKHKDTLDIWDVRLNIKPKNNKEVNNEIDVSFMKNYHLNIIECKSGNPMSNEALYKLEAVIGQIRALHVRSWLATTSNEIFNKDGKTINENLLNRASLYRCSFINKFQIQQLAVNIDSPHKIKEIIFGKGG